MSLDQHHHHGVDDGLPGGAWEAEGFVPATYERLVGAAPAAEARREPAEADDTVEACVVLRLPSAYDGAEAAPADADAASQAWADVQPWRRGPQRARRGAWTR